MMEINVLRVKSNDDATLSWVGVDGRFQCYGLEDEPRADKIAGETRIPAGKYKVGVRKTGGFHKRYTGRFPDFHRGMLHVIDVPGFEYILIHIGNTDDDTAGCLLLGTSANINKQLSINNSTGAYKKLYAKVMAAAEAGDLTITYVDAD